MPRSVRSRRPARPGPGQPDLRNPLVPQPAPPPVPKRRGTPPRRRTDLRRTDHDAGLLTQLPYRRFQVGLAGVDAEPDPVDGHPVAVRQGAVLAVAFHPELTDDTRVHAWLVDQIRNRSQHKEPA